MFFCVFPVAPAQFRLLAEYIIITCKHRGGVVGVEHVIEDKGVVADPLTRRKNYRQTAVEGPYGEILRKEADIPDAVINISQTEAVQTDLPG